MATKKELLEEIAVKEISGITEKNTIAEIQAALKEHTVGAKSSADTDEPSLAKAGKRSAKAVKEEEAKQEKEARKASSAATTEAPKKVITPTRSKLERKGKYFKKSAALVDPTKSYNLDDTVSIAKKTSHVKFDATVELHVRLGVDPRHADQNIRDTLVLPAGTGKNVRIAVLTEDPATAKAAGAAIAGTDDLFALFDKGSMDFDVLIATPALMPKLGKYARVLGPRGLMPNPKSGTVTNDIDKAVAEAKAGRVEYRVDSTGIVHIGVGKVSFTEQQLKDNIQAVITSIRSNKPASFKGNYFKAAHVATTMGPSIVLDLASIS